ncbi:MAG: hypothetical protein IH610_06145, partial [Deltaproteobacteria bacterium]|nr:hypothetical protein [Deltaproteobacteria bacterium]
RIPAIKGAERYQHHRLPAAGAVNARGVVGSSPSTISAGVSSIRFVREIPLMTKSGSHYSACHRNDDPPSFPTIRSLLPVIFHGDDDPLPTGGDMILRIGVAAFILLTSCARTQFVARQPVAEQARVITSFKTEIPETKSVGETMIERVYLQTHPGFVANEDFDIPKVSNLDASPPPFPKGARWRCMQRISADEYVCSAITSNRSIALGKQYYELAINTSGEIIGIFEKTFGNLIKFDDVISGKLLPIDVPNGKSYRQEWIYSGSSESIVKISYREYKNNIASPFFVEDLTYDIASSREIAVQDLRIEIMLVTEWTINYLVKK